MLVSILILSLIFTPQAISAPVDEALAQRYDAEKVAPRGTALKKARTFGEEVQSGELRLKADEAIGIIIENAASELSKRGMVLEANIILAEWRGTYAGFLLGKNRAIGDHEGISWMLSIHDRIHDLIGEQVCHALRLHDLYTLAYCLPMMLYCANESQATVAASEYEVHFSTGLGIIAYWVSWSGCLVLGGNMACGLLGQVIEGIVVRCIGPKLSPKFYPKSCK